jgi:hypothetical protein
MRTLLRLLTLAALAFSLSGCGLLVGHLIRENTRSDLEESQVIASLARYRRLCMEAAPDRLADMFSEAGELSLDGEPPHVGPAAISAYLKSPALHGARACDLRASSTKVDKAAATQSGRYVQTLPSPAGGSGTTTGTFEADWLRQADGRWLLTRLRTLSSAGGGT